MRIRRWIQERIGESLYCIGIRPRYSSGIHGGYTAGYGNLDQNGYWKFPSYKAARKAEEMAAAWENWEDWRRCR